jgi:hypothetical protein
MHFKIHSSLHAEPVRYIEAYIQCISRYISHTLYTSRYVTANMQYTSIYRADHMQYTS